MKTLVTSINPKTEILNPEIELEHIYVTRAVPLQQYEVLVYIMVEDQLMRNIYKFEIIEETQLWTFA